MQPCDGQLEAFRQRFGADPAWHIRSPGRVNLLGEHTDYNGGLVLPAAIDLGIEMLARPNGSGVLQVHSDDFGDTAVIDLSHPKPLRPGHWSAFPAGVAIEWQALGLALPGADCLLSSTLPMGSGLSSSAAIEMAFISLFENLTGHALEDWDAARLGQRVEHRHIGVQCGLMDQLAVRCGRASHAMMIDFGTNELTLVPAVPAGYCWVIADTRAPRSLAASAYNQRVEECRRALARLNEALHRNAPHLSAFSLEEVEQVFRGEPDDVEARRARHVVSENQRVRRAAAALTAGDLPELGRLLHQSHTSLRKDYEVSSGELDTMTAAAEKLPGCAGARMTGAGFGGCTVQLVEEAEVESFCDALIAVYESRFETGATATKVQISDGARPVPFTVGRCGL
ncbi:MAG: galactokinase [Candidatus Hydrogenedens sp.]|nr:galactokinase [Candidatus Hydrogenedens sp.]